MSGSLLEIRNVSKQFTSVQANSNVNLEIREGEIFALLGPNGAGKTTLLRMILGILRPDSGSISLHVPNPVLSVGYLPEDRGLYKDTPVLRTLVFFGTLRGMSKPQATAEGTKWLERLELGPRAKDKLDTLSKGNQQKVQFAAAVLHRPKFAVLDEPFSGLDPVNQERFVDLIRELRDSGTTVLLSAHHMSLVERLADRLAVMNRGQVVQYGTLPEIRKNLGARRRVQLRLDAPITQEIWRSVDGLYEATESAPNQWELEMEEDRPVGDLLDVVRAHARILDVHSERVGLHELYLRAVGLPTNEEVAA